MDDCTLDYRRLERLETNLERMMNRLSLEGNSYLIISEMPDILDIKSRIAAIYDVIKSKTRIKEAEARTKELEAEVRTKELELQLELLRQSGNRRVNEEELTSALQRLTLECRSEAASRYTASSCRIPTIAYTAMHRIRFMEPNILTRIVDRTPTPTELNMAMNALKNGAIAKLHPAKINETQPKNSNYEFTVDETMGDAMEKYFSTSKGNATFFEYGKYLTLSDVGAVVGPATEKSNSDGLVYSTLKGQGSGVNHRVGLTIMEWKETSYSSEEALGQAIAEGSNIVFSQLRYGLDSGECAVGIFCSNGRLCQFGYMTLLEPSCPIFHATSPILDLANPTGLVESAHHLSNLHNFCTSQHNLLQSRHLHVVSASQNLWH